MLDVISDGRLEFGIGRGYQPREAEVFGWPFATIQDQERNRAYYQEAYEIIIEGVDAAVVLASRAVLHDSAGVHAMEPSADDRVLRIRQGGPQTRRGAEHRRARSVRRRESRDAKRRPCSRSCRFFRSRFSGRIRKCGSRSRPSDRSNGRRSADSTDISSSSPTRVSRRTSRLSIAKSEKAGWPDRLGRGPLKYGWDAEKRRGVLTGRYIHMVLPGHGSRTRTETLQGSARGAVGLLRAVRLCLGARGRRRGKTRSGEKSRSRTAAEKGSRAVRDARRK